MLKKVDYQILTRRLNRETEENGQRKQSEDAGKEFLRNIEEKP